MKPSPALAAVQSNRPLVIAHRGHNKVAPENTLPAFAAALPLGVDFVELDYFHSADGVPIVFHDQTLDRCTDAYRKWRGKKIPLASKSLAELRTLDAGAWFDPKFAGTRIATLEEALDVIQPGSMTLIERKGGDAATFVKLLRRKKAIPRVAVQAFDWDYLADVHRLAPTIVTGALGDKKLTARRLEQMVACGASFVGWKHEDLKKSNVAAIRARGLAVFVYTINDEKRARRLLDWGVRGLISNEPERMKEVVAEHKRAGK